MNIYIYIQGDQRETSMLWEMLVLLVVKKKVYMNKYLIACGYPAAAF